MKKHFEFSQEKVLNGSELRSKLLDNFSIMLRPVRIMLDIDRSRLAELSGLPEEFIKKVEAGEEKFTETHYLALASVFSYAKFTVDEKNYRAMIKILINSDEFPEDIFNDFALIKIWYDTYFENYNQYEEVLSDEYISDEEDENEDMIIENKIPDKNLALEEIAGKYKLLVDNTAAADENFPALITRLTPSLKKTNTCLVMPETVLEKLCNELKDSDEDEKINLSSALNFLRRQQEEGLIEIIPSTLGDFVDDNVENSLLDIIENNKNTNYILITQDYRRVAAVNETISAYINDKGDLILWQD